MTVTIYPSALSGTVAAPPSKSMAHRLLICAGLAAGGESSVLGVAPSEDVLATLDCLAALGAEYRYDGETVTIRGATPWKAPAEAVLPCRECGSTLRFFIPLCLFSGHRMVLTGSETLLKRPLSVYEELCRKQGVAFEKGPESLRLCGKLHPGTFEVPGDISSQFVSGLLFALPMLGGRSVIRLLPPVESRAYINMTLAALDSFGVSAAWKDRTTLAIPGNQTYLSRYARVEGDWSNAAFFLALGVPVTGLDADSLQGDRVCVEYFERLSEGPAALDISDCPDLGPVLFAFAAMHHGGVFTGTRRLKLKESDRGAAMQEELLKFGVPMAFGENTITVGHGLRPPTEKLDGHNDHRIVMALCVLCTRTGGTIVGAEAVNKSFPDFFERMKELNCNLVITPSGGDGRIGNQTDSTIVPSGDDDRIEN